MCKGLSQKGIAEISIFDVVIDLCLLDGFDLLASPPSTMMSGKHLLSLTRLWFFLNRPKIVQQLMVRFSEAPGKVANY